MSQEISRIQEVEAYNEPNNPWVKVYFDRVRFPNGKEGRFNRIIEGSGQPGVVVLPLSSAGVGLVRQYRYPIGQEVWELPRGFGEGPDPSVDARRELKEETGLEAEELIPLGVVYPNSGILAMEARLFAARCQPVTEEPLDDEVSRFRWFRKSELLEKIDSGEINDAFTLAAVQRALLRGLLGEAELGR